MELIILGVLLLVQQEIPKEDGVTKIIAMDGEDLIAGTAMIVVVVVREFAMIFKIKVLAVAVIAVDIHMDLVDNKTRTHRTVGVLVVVEVWNISKKNFTILEKPFTPNVHSYLHFCGIQR